MSETPFLSNHMHIGVLADVWVRPCQIQRFRSVDKHTSFHAVYATFPNLFPRCRGDQ